MNHLSSACDEFYVSSHLFLKLNMTLERETVLHFFDRIRKEYPGLRKLRKRDEEGLVLEEDQDDRSSRRWLRLDQTSLRFGHFAPRTVEEVPPFGQLILTQAPYHLSFSDIDFDHLEVVFGFDLEYSGNHDDLVAETLAGDGAAAGFLFCDKAARVIDAQPYLGIALNHDCDQQAYIEIKSRTTTYEVRCQEFDTEPISVMLTVRQYWGSEDPPALDEAFNNLFDTALELATDQVIPGFVNPLAVAIASRP